MSAQRVAALQDMAHRLRIDSIESTSQAGSGHPTSCASMAEIMAVLFFDTMRYHVKDPRNLANDRFILSKGHAAPILYAAWAEAGLFPTADLLNLRKIDSDLEGHPTPRLPFVDVATGSLGQGLSAACGMAYAAKYLEKSDCRFYCLMGDGETAEGSVWEAASFASFYKLDNLVAVVDVNRLGQSEPTMFQHETGIYHRRFGAFGWNAVDVDGHDIAALQSAFSIAEKTAGRPTILIAKTIKGKDFPGIADQENWHGKPLGDKTAATVAHLKGLLRGVGGLTPEAPPSSRPAVPPETVRMPAPDYKKGDKVATRAAFGSALVRIGAASQAVVALDGDTKNSTYSEKMKTVDAGRFIECYIAEQNLVGVGIGLGTRELLPFVSTFACFLTRAFDQIRMGAISQANVTFVGSHAGVSIGQDGPSQMALEDLAMFRTVPGSIVFYPSDAVACERAVELAANTRGIKFIRTGRPAAPVIYDNQEPFGIGMAKVVRFSPDDRLTIVAAGVTLFEALNAADRLAKDGFPVRVIDPFTIKPLDQATILTAAKQTGGRVLTVEDHYSEGGIGDAVAAAVSHEPGIVVHKLAVQQIPRSGEPDELLDRYGISARIRERAVEIIRSVSGSAG